MLEHQSSIFGVGHVQHALNLTTPPPTPKPLTEKYRPQRFAEVFGQGAAVCSLQQFVEAPYPAAFLFEGETGTGKTSLALALANELDVSEDWGLHRIKSGAMDAEAVESVLRTTRYAAPGGGWKMVICDEADSMSVKARQLWLSALEEIPTKTVIVFTSNHVGKFEQRFLDRCERFTFASDPITLRQDARLLIERVWTGEGYSGEPPILDKMPGIIEDGAISFRRVVQAVQAYRRQPAPAAPKPTPAPAVPPVNATSAPKAKFEPVKPGWKINPEYRLVACHTSHDAGHQVWVNPAGWRFEYVLGVAGTLTKAVTHSESVGNAWAEHVRSLAATVNAGKGGAR
jgi:hypothetical protein